MAVAMSATQLARNRCEGMGADCRARAQRTPHLFGSVA
jgi:hypothetical protein